MVLKRVGADLALQKLVTPAFLRLAKFGAGKNLDQLCPAELNTLLSQDPNTNTRHEVCCISYRHRAVLTGAGMGPTHLCAGQDPVKCGPTWITIRTRCL